MQRARIVQLTDLHLTARAGRRVFGSDVWANLDRVLEALAALDRADGVDRVVLTGDVANSGAADAYARLAQRLAPWRGRMLVLPGNHDHRERLRAAFAELWPGTGQRLGFAEDVGAWRLVGLDSQVPHRTRGEVGAPQLAWLQARLAAHRGPWLLFLHHPPVRVGCWWLDKDLLRDRAALAAVLAPRPPRAVFAGHVHQQHVGPFAGSTVTTTPAVAYQYAPHSWLPLPRSRAPAMRVIELECAGEGTGVALTSRVERP